MENKKFYLTFGQKSPFRDGYVLVIGTDIESVRESVFWVFGEKFSNIYEEADFKPEYFSAGQLGKTLYAGQKN